MIVDLSRDIFTQSITVGISETPQPPFALVCTAAITLANEE